MFQLTQVERERERTDLCPGSNIGSMTGCQYWATYPRLRGLCTAIPVTDPNTGQVKKNWLTTNVCLRSNLDLWLDTSAQPTESGTCGSVVCALACQSDPEFNPWRNSVLSHSFSTYVSWKSHYLYIYHVVYTMYIYMYMYVYRHVYISITLYSPVSGRSGI